jgi:hypothetical protein
MKTIYKKGPISENSKRIENFAEYLYKKKNFGILKGNPKSWDTVIQPHT